MSVFDWLLRLYPSGFRAEYGEQMRGVYEEKRRAAHGLGERVALLAEVAGDALRNAPALHVDVLRQDVRQAMRALRRSPVFALTVVGVTALGIGANTAVFAVVDHVLVRPFPYPESDRLVRVWEAPPGYTLEASPLDYRDWLERSTSFEGLAAFTRQSANLTDGGEPVHIAGAAVTQNLQRVLRVPPQLGRWFRDEEDAPDAAGTVVLSDGLWRQRYGADPGVVGRTIELDGGSYEVVGVMPPYFRFPDAGTRFWVPLRLAPADFEDRANNYLQAVARLAPGRTVEQARTEMVQIMAAIERENPATNRGISAIVNPLRKETPSQARLLLIALMGASLGVLLIACLNVANLQLARALARQHEFATRASLGAGRERLVRQLVTESLVLAVPGGAAGVLLAFLALPLLSRLVPATLPLAGSPSLDARVLGFGAVATILTGLAFGALPALRVGRRSLSDGLRTQTRSSTAGGSRLRGALVVAEVMASVTLLVATGLLIRALGQVRAEEPGFRVQGVLTMRTWLPWPRYAVTAERSAFYSSVLEEVKALPGVTSAAFTSFLPMVMGGGIWPVDVGDGEANNRSANQTASLRFVTSEYHETLEIPLLAGRLLDETDTFDQPFVAVVSKSFADRYWPGRDPLGRTFTFAFAERRVVGVVGDVRVRGLEQTSEPQVWLPHAQVPDSALMYYAPRDLAIRGRGDLMALVPAVRDIVRRADPGQPVSDVALLEDIVEGTTETRSTQVRLTAVFAGLAFLLAAIGIHGLLAFTAGQRSREFGLRLALGARRRDILGMVLRDGARLGALGGLLGILLGYVAARGLQSVLFNIGPTDRVTFAAAVVLAVVMTLLGSLPPAWRAARLDPNLVMRDG